jgi:ADP-ribose pyrophosphatase
MRKEIKVLAKKVLYKGFNNVYACELEVPSLDAQKDYNRPFKREVIQCSDAVFVLIYAPCCDSFVFCQEFRAGVFFNKSNDDPFILECVAGMIDRDSLPEEIARAEVYEEAGLTAGKLQLIAKAYSSPGRMTEKVYFFYTEVAGIPQKGLFGLETESEDIATHIVKRTDAYKMMDELKIIDSMTLLALNWFRANH